MSTNPTSAQSRRPAGTPTGGQFAPETHAEPEITIGAPSPGPESMWGDDSVQFPRLLSEIAGTIEATRREWDALCENMDITHDELEELFDRAHAAWKAAKERTPTPVTPHVDGHGDTYWYNAYGEVHRTDGPAVERADGTREWWIHGKVHRDDGPAVEFADGAREWWIHGKHHRTDGPAIETPDGYLAWWVDDQQLTEEEFRSRYG